VLSYVIVVECGAPRESKIWTEVVNVSATVAEALRFEIAENCELRTGGRSMPGGTVIAPGAVISGFTRIGANGYVGAGSVIKQTKQVGAGAVC